MMKTTRIEELQRMAVAGLKTLPAIGADVLQDAVGSPAAGARSVTRDPAAYVTDLLKTSRELAKRRSPEETAALERQLEEREG
ncbi:hypothetical protein [Bosea sp. (in: a-proteobacteria)]|jgi:hypothetical protein|uniref:hypothetical protein n=1 Tax=Bosea sp. (in: a-proteobacteria) TaxID=1871050 RepID=UPI003F72E08E